MKQIYRFDKEGYLLYADIIDKNEELPLNSTEVPCEDGFNKPRWNGVKWVEGLTQVELDELNKPKPQEPTEKERIAALELALLEIL